MPAGAFAHWLEQYLRAQLQTEPVGDVPCGECNACCKASYFVAIDQEEHKTLERIPRVHLTVTTDAGTPQWTLDQSCSGSCPMLVDGDCSIYEHRPRTCRRFDCRAFAASAVGPGSGPRAAVNEQVWRWRFDYPSARDASRQTAVIAAAVFLQRRLDLIGADVAPSDAGELAKAAVLAHELFLDASALPQDDEQIAAALTRELRRLC